jgi:hypothetical protein
MKVIGVIVVIVIVVRSLKIDAQLSMWGRVGVVAMTQPTHYGG